MESQSKSVATICDTNANSTSASPTNETIYEFGRHLDSPSHVVSERVQTLASQIYTELQRIINRCNDDEDVVGGLMPLIVNVLESLDLSLIENQQLQVELELCKDDNEQLVTAFEKEKTNKKKVEQRLFEFEFTTDEEKQLYQQKIDSLANIVKLLELKAKNSADHSVRLEEKETEMKKEYNKLHERYNEVLRSHCDLMERVKILIGSDEAVSSLGNSNILSFNFHPLKMQYNKRIELECSGEEANYGDIINKSDHNSPSGVRNTWDTDLSLEDASIIEDMDDIPKDRDSQSLTGQNINQREYASTGMEKEIENLITENNELLETKNALNIVKDDLIAKVDELQSELTMCKDEIQQRDAVKDRLKSRISLLEEDLKKTKDDLEDTKQKLLAHKEDDEEGIPMAQRKRFTRVEMARVLMERNQYKERLIELQEAIRWSELIKATKNESDKKSAIWKFFSNLFSTSSAPPVKDSRANSTGGMTAVRYSASNPTSVTPALEAMRKRARAHQAGAGNDLLLLMDSDMSSERSRALRRAQVNRSASGDRVQAYGWSIAGASNNSGNNNPNQSSDISYSGAKGTSVPVPIYCRPLSGDDVGMKIWCACAVDLSGGEAGFPSNEKPDAENNNANSQIIVENEEKDLSPASKDMSTNALSDLENELNQALNEQISRTSDSHLSTFVWICSVSHSRSKVTIVNIRSNPGEVLDSFLVKTHLLCVASIPGAKVNDFRGTEGIEENGNEIKFVHKELSRRESAASDVSKSSDNKLNDSAIHDKNDSNKKATSSDNVIDNNNLGLDSSSVKSATLDKLSEYVAYTEPPSPTNTIDDTSSTCNVFQPMSTCLPTMWLGGQNAMLYVHSSIAQWSHCIATIKLSDSILQIVHDKGRVFVALANGQCCVFLRSTLTGEWDFTRYYIVDIAFSANIISNLNASSDVSSNNKSVSSSSLVPNQTALYSIRCIEIAKDMVWLGYRNLIFVLNAKSLKVAHYFSVHPRKETQVRQLTVLGDGVWCSLRLDSTLKLYSAIKPYQHLQDVDIEPYVSKMLSPKAFSFIRITALKASNGRLWIGTANGVILSLPCAKESADSTQNPTIFSANDSGRLSMSTYVPVCNVSAAQLSFHGHKDAVKFFVCTKSLILSGGEGYIDFRLNGDDDATSLSKGDRSHLIVWEITP